ncbi:MAG: SH3 domain-containing protein [Chloroflexi bacterium]|nr:SH3 domain-containing protein [Chloroflexota bacterium]
MKMRIALAAILALTALFAIGVPAQAQATNTVTWLAQYYNNVFLSGVTPAYQTQVYNGLNLDFGAGSPDAAIQADNFSARFTTDAFFSAGTYRFSIRADDEFSFRVNDVIVLSTLDAGQPNTILTVDLPLSGSAHLQLDYRERSGGALVSLSWVDVNAQAVNVPTGTWLAEYFPNQFLSQPTAAIFNESSPSHNWGFSAPLPSMPAEYWSARWRTSQSFAAGTYRFTVRADDGVRVYVDNVVIIDRFSESPGAENVADYTISAGSHVITVEYVELFNNAFIDFKIEQISSPNVTPSQPGAATATVNTFILNVRNVPSTNNSFIITKIRRGEVYPVVGSTSDKAWYKLNVNGTEGWVSGSYILLNNAQSVPNLQDTPTLNIPAGSVATQGIRVNFRNGPSTDGTEILTIIPTYTIVRVVGRNTASSWLQVEYNGRIGWGLATLFYSPTPLNYGAIPVTG